MAQGFDPNAATNAYLATLSPEAHAKATAYTQGGHWVLLFAAIVSVLVSWIVIRTGLLVRVRAGVEAKKPHPWLAVIAVVVVDQILEGVLSIPWDTYAQWWREKSYGLTSRGFEGWFSEHLLLIVFGIVQSIILFSLLYFAIRRFPKTWWIWSSTGVVFAFLGLFILQLFLLEPLLNNYKPAPPGPLRDTIVAMANQVGVPSGKVLIYDGSKQSNRYTANAGGFAGFGRIAMSDVMFKKDADLAEVKGVVGHEMGHYVHGHVPLAGVVLGLFALVAFFLLDRLFPLFCRLLGANGVMGLADPAGIPVVSVIFTLLVLLATPITNTFSRWQEADADHFSVVHFNEPDGMAKALVKTIEYRADSPSKLEEFIFYDHPSVRARVQALMDWKAAHPKPDAVSDGPAPAAAAPATPTIAPTEAPR